MKLKDRVVVITGAGAGIGRATAIEFAKEGAGVAVVDIRGDLAVAAASEIRALGGQAVALSCDVSDAASVEEMSRKVDDALGPAGALVNNAAIQVNKRVEDTTPEEWARQMAVNVGGMFHCVKSFLPQLRRTRGAIVNMSSVNGFFVEPMCAGYCASKGAIIAFTKAIAIDHGREGIRCNCICPGYIDAGLAWGYFEAQPDPAAARAAAGKLHAMGRVGKPEEVGRVAVFLASEESSFMTGAAVVVDGGFGSGLPLGE
jgi:NAD(P)-dependent dehydrogenase (short-subunit alcohol dehydrogenase family)